MLKLKELWLNALPTLRRVLAMKPKTSRLRLSRLLNRMLVARPRMLQLRSLLLQKRMPASRPLKRKLKSLLMRKQLPSLRSRASNSSFSKQRRLLESRLRKPQPRSKLTE